MHIWLNYEPKNWNSYINAERTNKFMANSMKQADKNYVVTKCKSLEYKGSYPIQLIIRPHYSSKRQDLDNYRYKGLIDGLVSAGVIKNDNLNCIERIVLDPIFDTKGGVDIYILANAGEPIIPFYEEEEESEVK